MIAIVFDSPPGPVSQFVEVERDGKGIKFGEWKEKADGYWHLELVEVDHLEKQLAEAQAELAEKKLSYKNVLKAWRKTCAERDKLHDDQIDLSKQLAEAQRTIRIAYSDVPGKGYDAEATLSIYMNNHNLEEW